MTPSMTSRTKSWTTGPKLKLLNPVNLTNSLASSIFASVITTKHPRLLASTSFIEITLHPRPQHVVVFASWSATTSCVLTNPHFRASLFLGDKHQKETTMNKLPFEQCSTCDSKEYCRNNTKKCLTDDNPPVMTISKAIEILDLNIKKAAPTMPPDVKDALALSLKALRFCQYFSPNQVPFVSPQLPLYLSIKPPEHPFGVLLLQKQKGDHR